MDFSVFALFFYLLTWSQAQWVEPPTDLTNAAGGLDLPVRYKQVPADICNLPSNVSSYSGFVDVDEYTHIFFWFFEAQEDPANAPLTVYFDGGPGYPAEPAVYVDLGLCANTSYDQNNNITNPQYAWSNLTNVLVIDQPNQVGFSYNVPTHGYINNTSGNFIASTDCPDYANISCGTFPNGNYNQTANSTWNAAPAVWQTVQGFLGVDAFSQYADADVHIATISYGGHFGPVFGHYFEQQNDKIKNGTLHAQNLNLKTVFIADGWIDPQLQYASFYNFTGQVPAANTYGFQPYNKTVDHQMYDYEYGFNQCWDQIQDCYDNQTNTVCINADNFCANNVQATFDNATAQCGYDYATNNGDCEDNISASGYEEGIPDPDQDYLNNLAVLKGLGAFTNWTLNNVVMDYSFYPTGDDARTTLPEIQALVDRGVYVVTYFGDSDYVCNWVGGRAVAERLDAPGYCSAGFTNLTTDDNLVHGQVRQSDNYAFVRIYQSGHVVPYWQPLAVFTMLDRAIHGFDLAQGTTQVGMGKGYKTTGPPNSTYEEGPAGLINPYVGET